MIFVASSFKAGTLERFMAEHLITLYPGLVADMGPTLMFEVVEAMGEAVRKRIDDRYNDPGFGKPRFLDELFA